MRQLIPFSLNHWLVIGLLFGLGASCDSSRQPPAIASAFVFPGSRFTGEGVECVLSLALRQPVVVSGVATNWVNISLDELRKFLADAGESTEQIAAELADPFIVEPLPFVQFTTQEPGSKIAAYYETLLRSLGWKEVRGIFAIETTLCGGDWLRVFQKGKSQVLLHVCGPWDKQKEENNKWALLRTIKFKFRGIAPSELLGLNYRKS